MVVAYASTRGVLSCRFTSPSVLTAAVAAVIVLVMMNNINCCGAALLMNSNATYDRYCVNGGAADENCLIAEDLELEFLMDSHVSRMLESQIKPATAGAEKKNAPAKPCGNTGNGEQYCLPKAQKVPENCGQYNKGCQ